MNDKTATPQHRSIAGIDLEVLDRGRGEPIVYLHGGGGLPADMAFIDLLAKNHRVIAPTHPGFGSSSLPDWLDSVDDIAHVHLELLDKLGVGSAKLIGMSLGGWIGLEMATKTPERFSRIALIGPVGVKTGTSDKLDIPDVFAMPADKRQQLLFHDPQKFKPDFASMTDEQLTIVARNQETLAMLVWEPFMHNPKLKHRLHRVRVPVVLTRGASDGIVSADYLERYAKLFPNATISTIATAGHSPQIEQPQITADTILKFLDTAAESTPRRQEAVR
jgi:pimeloyl-ACP methyl ester carboxylesterase